VNQAFDYQVVLNSNKKDDKNRVVNAMSVDVEEYFHAHSLEQHYPRDTRSSLASRVEHSTYRLLDMLDESRIKSTFFILGSVSKRTPGLVREILNRGHEVASHGMDHYRASEQDPKTFLKDISDSKAALEDTIGNDVLGYRAASFSIGPENWWAYDLLEEAGYKYSSSLCHGRFDRVDIAIPATPFIPARGKLVEIPITRARFLGKYFATGGGFFRIFPYALFKYGLANAAQNTKSGPMVFYFHPWEIDADQPVAPVNLKTKLRHYGNLNRMEKKLNRVFSEFAWERMNTVFEEVISSC
jgi:peptidoglycan-N-acetylglucosamine deacetylase